MVTDNKEIVRWLIKVPKLIVSCYYYCYYFFTDALAYLTEHKIPQLFEHFTARIVYHRPSDPKAFIKDHLRCLKESRDKSEDTQPSLFNDSNLISIFSMLDIRNSGYITKSQYNEAMLSLGITNYNISPVGGEMNKISRDTFLHEAKIGLKLENQTFSD